MSARFILSLVLALVWPAFGILDVPEARAGVCDEFAAAKQASPKDPRVKKVVAVWRRLSAPFEAMTGRKTAVAVLDASAGVAGEDGETKPFRPTGHICPGAPPVVYVTWPLVERVYVDEAYPEDFIAFVLGHELGHRYNDLSPQGSMLGREDRPGKGRSEEPLADKRAAFYAASAGFSMRSLARDAIVSDFLANEAHVRRGVVATRTKALKDTLRRFDAYEDLFQASIVMLSRDDTQAALRMLAAADEHVSHDGVPLPELKVVRAIALMRAAAPHAPWLEPHATKIPVQHLRCDVVFPSHSALSEEADSGSLRGASDESFEDARRMLARAEKLLDEAQTYGVNELVLTNARACHALYMGEHEVATKLLGASLKLAADAPDAVKGVLEADRALAAFAGFLDAEPPPSQTKKKAVRTWRKKVKSLGAKKLTADPELTALTARLAKYPDVPAEEKAFVAPAACGEGVSAPAPPELPEFTGTLGECPKGWMLMHSLPTVEDAKEAGSSLGFTVCRPASFGVSHDTLVSIRLQGATDPPLEPVEVDMFVRDYPQDARAPLEHWTCSGNLAKTQGTSDAGELVTLFTKATAGIFDALAFSVPSGAVRRVVFFAE